MNPTQNAPEWLLYRDSDAVKIGGVQRYKITYTPSESPMDSPLKHPEGMTPESPLGHPSSLWLKIRNTESMPMRAAYLTGPFLLYVHVVPEAYNQNEQCYVSADQPSFEPQLKAGQNYYVELHMNKLQESYTWTVDIMSQIIFSASAEINYEILVGESRDHLHRYSGNAMGMLSDYVTVLRQDTVTLWHQPVPRSNEPVHLVVITHGLHSNTGADMLYIKEKIDEAARQTGENLIVRGYHGNAAKTERGVRYLGRRVAKHIMEELVTKDTAKISFIGHSLGGLIMIYAIAYIRSHDPTFFDRIKPQHLITLASPLLGVSNENPAYVRLALDIGFIGRTGQDLGLTKKPLPGYKPLLRMLPTGHTHEVLRQFQTRTVYANALNDGIVPLRTSALLYLDWKGLSKVASAKKGDNTGSNDKDRGGPSGDGGDKGSSNERDKEKEAADTGKPTGDINATSAEEAKIYDEASKRAAEDPQAGEIPNSDDRPVGSRPAQEVPPSGKGIFHGIQAAMSLMMPHGPKKKPSKIYLRSQTMISDDDDDGNMSDSTMRPPPKSSVIESAASVLAMPLPSHKFICDPESRAETIIHDRVYYESDLPPRRFKKQKSLNCMTDSSDKRMVEKAKMEERIAREYHHEMSWRKVLCRLEPDAHNNIAVRRRFANAFGWPVIDHLVKTHFIENQPHPTKAPKQKEQPVVLGVPSVFTGKFSPPISEVNSSTALPLHLPGEVAEPAFFEISRPETPGSPRSKNSHSSESIYSVGQWHRDLAAESETEGEDGLINNANNLLDGVREWDAQKILPTSVYNSLYNTTKQVAPPPPAPLEQDTIEDRFNEMTLGTSTL
ncbi:putative lipase ROG1 [Yarrowia sp. C11]|nr:putative lipase ROG1 [Yarrowia sp. C11]KAG5359454.1 putative lipase ROG1 [Yarrowia sp. E02]